MVLSRSAMCSARGALGDGAQLVNRALYQKETSQISNSGLSVKSRLLSRNVSSSPMVSRIASGSTSYLSLNRGPQLQARRTMYGVGHLTRGAGVTSNKSFVVPRRWYSSEEATGGFKADDYIQELQDL